MFRMRLKIAVVHGGMTLTVHPDNPPGEIPFIMELPTFISAFCLNH